MKKIVRELANEILKLLNIILILKFGLYMTMLCGVQASLDCLSRDDMHFVKISNKIADVTSNNILTSRIVKQPQFCLGLCRTEPLCSSFNAIYQTDTGLYRCDLLRINRLSLPSFEFINEQDSFYFEVKLSSPCSITEFKHYVPYASDCLDVYNSGFKETGVYGITIGSKAIQVLCDMTVDSPGWTVIQARKIDGNVSFDRNWNDYKNGFGRINEEFWVGNEYIYRLSQDDSEMKVDFEYSGVAYTATYSYFKINAENDNYRLLIEGTDDGTWRNAFFDHNNMYFSTHDNDNDIQSPGNCAWARSSGWWMKNCLSVNLNGKYTNDERALHWNGITPAGESLTFSKMSLRRKSGI